MIEIAVGTRLGRYRLLAPIGAGGMGKVWAALDQQSEGQRLVALKLSHAEEGTDPKYWSALADEANIAARIHHPNVCVSSGLGSFGGVRFLVMEWSDGASLRELLDALPDHRLPAFLAARIGVKVAAGLHAAHQLTDEAGVSLGVVHRDVSPQNVLIDRRGRVRIADFGVAKARGQLRRPTETGEIKGKLSYMAPEQIASKHVDARADVFALACVVYETALGQRAFPGSDALSTMYRILEEPPVSPRAIDPCLPERLEQALLKGLAKDPDARYQSALEFGEALEDFLDDELTEPGDRHLAKLLGATLGEQLEERRLAIEAAARRLDGGEPASPGRTGASITSTAPGGVAVTQRQRLPTKSNLPLLAAMLGAGAVLGAAWFQLRKPSAPGGAIPAATPAEPRPRLEESATPPVSVSAPPKPAPITSTETPVASATPSASGTPPQPARPRARPASVTAKPSSTMLPAAETPVVPRGPRAAPPKPPREIDQTNPFTER